VNIPIALFLLFLTGVGPLLAWRKTSLDTLKRNFAWPLGGGILAGVVAAVFGFREIYALICLVLSVFVTLTIGSEFYRGARVIAARDKTNLLTAVGELTMRNTRRYGGYVIHFAMVLIFIGVAGSAFNKDIQMEMGPGQTMNIGPYTILCQNFDRVANNNFESERATLEIFRKGHSEMMLYPERRFFLASQVTETMVAVQTSPVWDLYVVYAGRSPETGRPVIHAYLNPLVKWIWFGGVVLILGTILAMLPNRRTALVLRPAEARENAWGDSVGSAVRAVARSDAND
jgi:cytochrome c-type biogenesis protein CcmF